MKLLLGLILIISFQANAQQKTSAQPIEDELIEARWVEVQQIVDDIKKQNHLDRFKLKVRYGVAQLLNNFSLEDLKLGGQDAGLPAIAIEGVANLWGDIGFETRVVYAQNLMGGAAGSLNGTDAYMGWLSAGPRYTFYLDSTRLDNNVVVKLLYQENYNNFRLNHSAGTANSGAPIWIWSNWYQGFALGVERNIPITNKLGIMGSFDLFQIYNTSGAGWDTAGNRYGVARQGYGFEVQAEIYYKPQLTPNLPVRLGVLYWQQGNESEVEDTIKDLSGHSNYFQMTRAIMGSINLLF